MRRSSFLDLVVRGLWAGVGGSGGVLWRCCSAVDQKQNRGIGSFHESCVHDKERANAGGMGREGRDVGLESSFARTKDPHRPADPQKNTHGEGANHLLRRSGRRWTFDNAAVRRRGSIYRLHGAPHVIGNGHPSCMWRAKALPAETENNNDKTPVAGSE